MLEELISRVEEKAASEEPLDRLAYAVELAREVESTADTVVGHFVERARGAGCSWAVIGGALGVTKQAAQQRWVPNPLAGRERFTDRARTAVERANEHARRLHHGWVGTEHLLLGLFADPQALSAKVLAARGVTQAAVERRVTELVPPGAEALTVEPPLTPRAARTLRGTVEQALRLGHNYVGTEHILLALAAGEGIAAQVLEAEGLTVEAITQEVIRLLSSHVKKG